MSGPKYPNVRCHLSGKDEPGYSICLHIVDDDAQVAYVERATTRRLGVIQCDRAHHAWTEMSVICAHCARADGYIPS